MKNLSHRALIVGVAAALLAGCAGSPAGAPPGAAQNLVQPPAAAAARHVLSVSFAVLHRFGRHATVSHNHVGARPAGGLIYVNGTLYGTTSEGGHRDAGLVYSITTSGTKKVLHRFCCDDDAVQPSGDLLDVNGTLYGTSLGGGKCGAGTVYSIGTTGAESVLHSFCNGYDSNPTGAVIDVGGTLYGTAGESTYGVVYSITLSGTYTVLHVFKGGRNDGASPSGALLNVHGTLYGTTLHGGSGTYGRCVSNGGCGTVYSITTAGVEKVVYSFQNGSDGWLPTSGLVYANTTLYGTTQAGGRGGCTSYDGCGVVYSVTTGGTEAVLFRFGGGPDGGEPAASLIDVNGALYGTTTIGGSGGQGTVFSITPTGTEQVLHSFTGIDGADPIADLLDVNGTLYGTAYSGGPKNGCRDSFGNGCGTVFALTP